MKDLSTRSSAPTPPPHALAVRPGTQAPRTVGVFADRPGPRPAGPGHRRARARAGAGPGDPVVGPAAGDRGARGGGRDHPPGQRRDSPRNRRTGRASPCGTTCTRSMRCAGWTRCSARLHALRRLVRETPFDLWVGDESWEVDHFLHENPERKVAPYAFLTDVIGFLPVDPQGDPREAELCADYNAEMIEHRARYPDVGTARCSSAGPTNCPTPLSGRACPGVATGRGNGSPPSPTSCPSTAATAGPPRCAPARLRLRIPALVAAVGGTAVGRPAGLVAEAFALVRRQQPDARMVMVSGPACIRAELPDVEGLQKRGYVPELFAHLACADVAVVQGGLSTTMELVATRRPFIYSRWPTTGSSRLRRPPPRPLPRRGSDGLRRPGRPGPGHRHAAGRWSRRPRYRAVSRRNGAERRRRADPLRAAGRRRGSSRHSGSRCCHPSVGCSR